MYRVTQEIRLGGDNIIKSGSVVDGSQFDEQDTERLLSLGVLVDNDDSFEQEHYNTGAVVNDQQDQGDDAQGQGGDNQQDQQDQAEKPKSNRKNGG